VTLALAEQGNSSSTSAPNSPRPLSVDAPQDNTTTQEYTETTASIPEELREASGHDTPAQGLKEWEQQETQAVRETLARREPREDELVIDEGVVEIQQLEEVRGK
jgi:hypothetical protein